MYPNLNDSGEEGVLKMKEVFNSGKLGRNWKEVPALIIMCALTGASFQDTTEQRQQIKRIIHYNMFVSTMNRKYQTDEEKIYYDKLRLYDWLYRSREEIRANPNEFCKKIYNGDIDYLSKAPDKMLLNIVLNVSLAAQSNAHRRQIHEKHNGAIKWSNKKKKRTQVSAMALILINDLWHSKMPNKYITKIKEEGAKMHNDHLIPHSTRLNDDDVDLNRLGNYSPIMGKVNCKRQNGHISNYWNDENVKEIIDYLGIFPTPDEYDKMIKYKKNGSNMCPHLTDAEAYDKFCYKNEKKYIDSFLDRLFD